MSFSTPALRKAATFLSRCALVVACLAPLQASAFQLETLGAERTDLNDYIGDGRWTLVMFWSTDCVTCEAQKPMIEAFHEAHVERDAHVVGVAIDGRDMIDEIEAINARHSATYPNLVAFDDVFHEQYRTLTGQDFRATPVYVMFSPEGALEGVAHGAVRREALEAVVDPR